MLNRREFVRSTVIGLTTLVGLQNLPKAVAEEKSLQFADLVKSKLNNGIDRIFKVVDIKDFKPERTKFGPVPMFGYNENDNINDMAWHTLIAASLENKDNKFPATQFDDFVDTKATDLFVDSSICQYVKSQRDRFYPDNKCKIHSVNLKQYYGFYTDQMKQKFRVYRSSLAIAANFTDGQPSIIVKDNYFRVYVSDTSNFILGQI